MIGIDHRQLPGVPASCGWLFALCVSACQAFTFSSSASVAGTVAELDRASGGLRNAFAQAAVVELATAYSAVLSDARREGRADGAQWIAATEAYIENLTTIARAVDAGAEIRFLFGPEGPLRVVVGNDPVRQFMLAAPRPHERERLERPGRGASAR